MSRISRLGSLERVSSSNRNATGTLDTFAVVVREMPNADTVTSSQCRNSETTTASTPNRTMIWPGPNDSGRGNAGMGVGTGAGGGDATVAGTPGVVMVAGGRAGGPAGTGSVGGAGTSAWPGSSSGSSGGSVRSSGPFPVMAAPFVPAVTARTRW